MMCAHTVVYQQGTSLAWPDRYFLRNKKFKNGAHRLEIISAYSCSLVTRDYVGGQRTIEIIRTSA